MFKLQIFKKLNSFCSLKPEDKVNKFNFFLKSDYILNL